MGIKVVAAWDGCSERKKYVCLTIRRTRKNMGTSLQPMDRFETRGKLYKEKNPIDWKITGQYGENKYHSTSPVKVGFPSVGMTQSMSERLAVGIWLPALSRLYLLAPPSPISST